MMAQINGNKANHKEKQVEGYGAPSRINNGSPMEGDHHFGNTLGAGEARMNTKLLKIDFPYFEGGGLRE